MTLIRLPILLLALIGQSIILALGQIWANKMRSFLTMIGIVIGVASVTTVIASLAGMESNILSEFESLGTNKVFVMPHWPQSMRNQPATAAQIRFKPELFDDLLIHCPSVKAYTRVMTLGLPITFGTEVEASARITGIDPAWHQIESRGIAMGRPFSLIDNEQARPVCLITADLRDKLGLDRDCTGQSILIGDRRFMVVGLIEKRTGSGMFNDGMSAAEVFIPFSTAYAARPNSGLYVIAASQKPSLAEEATAELTFFLRKKRGLRPDEPATFRVEYVAQYVEQFKKIAGIITAIATAVVAISLLVGGVGIMNIMLVSVSERTREIGLRKAVGAPPAAVLLQFLVEAIVICLVGGLIGVLGGQMLTSLVSRIPGAHLEKAAIPGWAIVLAFGFAAGVGVIFGMFPAIKAARLDPIEALRHE